MDPVVKELEDRLKRVLAKCAEELSAVRSGRPSSELIGNIKFMYFDQMTPIMQAGSINVVPPRQIQISVWDKGAIPAIAKAIEDSKAGFSTSVNGNTIHATLAALSNERREELMKQAKKITETFRIEVRSERDDAMKKIKAAQDRKEMTEDDVADLKEEIQKKVTAANDGLEAALQKKVGDLAE